ncbi:MAG: hypothetical protein ACRD2J_05915 [Thermoanaerobaculia bacterium]
MRRLAPPLVIALVLLAAACGEGLDDTGRGTFRKGPVSIRGWFSEVVVGEPPPDVFALTDTSARVSPYQRRLFEETHVSIEGIAYASGGVADDGSFIILDAPPGEILVNMQAPGVPLVQMRLQKIPANADVFIPGIRLYPDRFELTNPEKILVRVPSREDQRRKAPGEALVGGHPVEIWEVPLREMMDRRDWPVPQ